jgi:kynurenine 3-monooxygenase
MGSERVTVVGAGPAGALLSIYLARSGHTVTVYEKRPDLRRVDLPAGRSINLALANRGLRALAEVGLRDQVQPLLIPMRGRMIHTEAGHLQLQPYGHRPHEVINSISRSGLTALLLDAAEATGRVDIRFNHECEEVNLNDHLLTLRDEITGAAQQASFNRVIGCDGIQSAVRHAVLHATQGSCIEEPLAHSYKELSIPPAPNGGFQMEANALHIWPRGEYMLIALPNLDGGFTVTLFLPNAGELSFASLTDAAALLRFFATQFPDALALMPRLAQEFFTNPTGRLSTLRVAPWHCRDDALILGDAAHAIVPFHGQGMNCAFEDCSAFDQCLARHGEAWEQVFAALEDLRRPDADAIADLSLENYVEMRSTVRDSRFQLKKELAWRLEDRHPERFIPRYSMVMFHDIPYAEAQRRGRIQDEILTTLTDRAHTLEDVDYAVADRLIEERLGQ